MDRRLKSACVAIVLLATTTGIATTAFAANVTVSIHNAMQGFKVLDPPGIDHPIVTATSHNANQIATELEVTNYSTKPVTEVEIGWRIAASAQCKGHTFPPRWGEIQQKLTIGPGKVLTLQPPEQFTSNEFLHQIIDEADRANAHAVIVTFGIVKATYADGSFWEDKDAGDKRMFDGGMAEVTKSCAVAAANTAGRQPRCQNVDFKLKKITNPLDQCWPTPARQCTARQVLNLECPFEDCVIVGCGEGCNLTWTQCQGDFPWPLNCNTVGGGTPE